MIENYFVCIGAQKSGTTWLARVLSRHPDLFLMPVKEIHYFDHVRQVTQHLSDRKRRSRYRKYFQRMLTQPAKVKEYLGHWAWYRDYRRNPIDDAWYEQLFTHRGSATFAGEVTPEYAILGRDGLEHIKRLAPGARALFIMRNPVTRAWSQVLHHCRRSGLDAMRTPSSELIAMIDDPAFHAFGDYDQTLSDMATVFEPACQMTMFYEDMHDDRIEALREVCTFVGLAFTPDMFSGLDRRFNRSQTAALPDDVRAHLRTVYRPTAERVQERLGRVPTSWVTEFDL